MSLFDFIDPFYFLVALCIGLFYTYITAPQPQIVIKYPTPFNAGKSMYVDQNDVCYKYKIEQVKCPDDISKIKRYEYLST